MANKEKHAMRSKRSHRNEASRSGMSYMDWNINLMNDHRRKMKEVSNASKGDN